MHLKVEYDHVNNAISVVFSLSSELNSRPWLKFVCLSVVFTSRTRTVWAGSGIPACESVMKTQIITVWHCTVWHSVCHIFLMHKREQSCGTLLRELCLLIVFKLWFLNHDVHITKSDLTHLHLAKFVFFHTEIKNETHLNHHNWMPNPKSKHYVILSQKSLCTCWNKIAVPTFT